jgi:hypothetical protein
LQTAEVGQRGGNQSTNLNLFEGSKLMSSTQTVPSSQGPIALINDRISSLEELSDFTDDWQALEEVSRLIQSRYRGTYVYVSPGAVRLIAQELAGKPLQCANGSQNGASQQKPKRKAAHNSNGHPECHRRSVRVRLRSGR